jgi:hypothetical protein
MKIASDAIIPKEKLAQYLLLPRQKNDKSQWLAQVGFSREQPDTLEKAIHQLITENDAIPDRNNEYGTLLYGVNCMAHMDPFLLSQYGVYP